MGAVREHAGNRGRANQAMHLPMLTRLSAGRSTPIPDADWSTTLEAAIAGDPAAIETMFAAGARWANRLVHSRPWLPDAEADVVTLMWSTLPSRPRNSEDWRTLVRRRLTRREYRPSREVVTAADTLESRLPIREFEAGVVDRLDALARLAAIGPLPPGMRPYAAAVLTDTVPPARSAQCARQWRYLQRRGAA